MQFSFLTSPIPINPGRHVAPNGRRFIPDLRGPAFVAQAVDVDRAGLLAFDAFYFFMLHKVLFQDSATARLQSHILCRQEAFLFPYIPADIDP